MCHFFKICNAYQVDPATDCTLITEASSLVHTYFAWKLLNLLRKKCSFQGSTGIWNEVTSHFERRYCED